MALNFDHTRDKVLRRNYQSGQITRNGVIPIARAVYLGAAE